MNAPLLSPITQAPLRQEGPDLLRDIDGRLWPMIDGIAYLRVGREALVEEAAAKLAAGDRDGALMLLLSDQDDWWTGPKPEAEALRKLLRERDRLSLRDALRCLAFDRVGDYFAHRWSDPTFLAGLGLIDAHWQPTKTAFELACGIGHYGRELARRGVAFTGGDVVFAKLWLARGWVVPAETRLICFDAAAPWPVADTRYDLVFCHDAFYFLEPKAAILAGLERLTESSGRVAISHIHNSGADNLSSGHAVSVGDMARLFPGAVIYDDAELTTALVNNRVPRAAPLETLTGVEAFSVEVGATGSVGKETSLPAPVSHWKLNPLYRESPGGWTVEWPSPRYEAEYSPRSTFPASLERQRGTRLLEILSCGDMSNQPDSDRALFDEAIRRRILVDLPERW